MRIFYFIKTVLQFLSIALLLKPGALHLVSAIHIKGLSKMIGKGNGIGNSSISNTMKSASKIN